MSLLMPFEDLEGARMLGRETNDLVLAVSN